MDGVAPLAQAAAPGCAPLASSGLFLHAGWRSCGTWVWERLREQASVRAYYEPLHEDLATLRPQDVDLLRPDSWQSGHGTGPPYFAEFQTRLRDRGRGVAGHQARFAFDPYFLDEGDEDPELADYLRGLMAEAAAAGRRPVLKFCRSLGRVAWMERVFPDVTHAVILREPLGQWCSARLQMERNRNRYFVLAPFVILACNPDHALLADAADVLGVRLPPRLSRNLAVTNDACWRHVQRLDWSARFRCFLALWVAAGTASLQGRAAVIDADALAGDQAHRRMAERVMGGAVGSAVDLTPRALRDGMECFGSHAERADAAEALAAARGFLAAHAHLLAPPRAALMAGKLAVREGAAAGPAGASRASAVLPGTLAHVDAAAYVALARATYPLRRAHFHVRRWLGRL